MPEKPDLKVLMNRVVVPKEFNASPILRSWYLEGAQDALEGKVASNEAELTRRLGKPAADAYTHGYKYGRTIKHSAA